MLLHDPYALHRKWWDRDWKPGPNDKDWTTWDYTLADVWQLIQDYTDQESGQWRPYDASGDIWWDVKSSFSGSLEAIERVRKSRGELEPGERLYAVPVFGEKKPTIDSWIQDMNDDTVRVPTEHKGARPPTPEELALLP